MRSGSRLRHIINLGNVCDSALQSAEEDPTLLSDKEFVLMWRPLADANPLGQG
jgi:hypothetical protein